MGYRETPDVRALLDERVTEAMERSAQATIEVATAERDLAKAKAELGLARGKAGYRAQAVREIEALERAGMPPDGSLDREKDKLAHCQRAVASAEQGVGHAEAALKRAFGAKTVAEQMLDDAKAERERLS